MKALTTSRIVMLSVVNVLILATSAAMAQEPRQTLTSEVISQPATIATAIPDPVALNAPEPAMLPVVPQPTSQRVTSSEAGPSARQIRTWSALLIAEHSAALFDAWSTRNSIQSGNGREQDPLVRPFANSAAIYPVLQIAPVGFDFLSHRMLRSRNQFLRRTWWIPQTAAIAGSLWSGSRNVQIANLKR